MFSYDEDANEASEEVDDESAIKENRVESHTPLPERPQKPQLSTETVTPSRVERESSEGLPQSFAALRPSSLPAPSNVRPPIRARLEGPKRRTDSSAKQSKPRRAPTVQPEAALSSQQIDIRKFVGAEMPTHRGSWKAGADSWKIFEGNNSDQTDEDESEADTESTVTQTRGMRSACIAHWN